MTQKSSGNGAMMSEREFVINAIRTLRKPDKKCIHSVWSHFIPAFEKQFGRKPFETLKWLESEKVVKSVYAKGKGSWLYLWDDWVEEQATKKDTAREKRVDEALQKILKGG